ncbi:MAG: hypothetical protein EOO42_20775 [Flavobacteriales bacterium]|nr:MAG: hypothetical protein EOO42_20775 [Flavobacteriales bacterium]
MAFQRGSVKLEGKVGDLTFYKVDDEYLAKQSTGHSKDRIANDPNFERTRENAKEFGQISSFAKNLKGSIKLTFGSSYELFDDSKQNNRLVKRLSSIVKADSINLRGERQILPENMNLLTGFSMNSEVALKDAFFGNYATNWMQEESFVLVNFNTFNPTATMDYPKKATSYRFHFAAIVVNRGSLVGYYNQLELTPITAEIRTEQLELKIEIQEAQAIILLLGISFYEEVAGYPVPMLSAGKNALDIISVIPI